MRLSHARISPFFKTLLKPLHHRPPLSFSSIFLRPLSSLLTQPTKKPLHLVFKEAVGLSPTPQPSSLSSSSDENPLHQTLNELQHDLKTLKPNPNAPQIKPTSREPEVSKRPKSLYEAFTNKVEVERGKEKKGREFSEAGRELSPDMEVVVSHLHKEGYFSDANFVRLDNDRLDFSCFETAYGRGFIKHAAERFANDKQEITKWLSGSELKTVALFGCPLPANKCVFTAKRLRKFFGIAEQTVCSKCVLRESCKYVNKNVWGGDPKLHLPNVGKANPIKLNLVDVMNTVTLYALDSMDPRLVVPEDVKSSVSRLLKEILKGAGHGDYVFANLCEDFTNWINLVLYLDQLSTQGQRLEASL